MITFNVAELDAIKGLLGASVTAVLGFASHNVWIKSKAQKIENDLSKVKNYIEAHKSIATEAVLFAQQAYSDFNGSKKLKVASDFMTKELSKFGYKTDSGTVDSFIQSALKDAKKEFGKLWSEVPAAVVPQSVVPNAPVSENK